MNMFSPRPATKEDLPALVALLKQCDLPNEDIDLSIQNFYISGKLQVDVCGALEIYDDYGLLRSLAVAPDKRGNRLGQNMARFILARAQQDKLKAIFLLTTTAEHFFPKLGFRTSDRSTVPEPVQKSSEFSSICPDSAHCLVKYLS